MYILSIEYHNAYYNITNCISTNFWFVNRYVKHITNILLIVNKYSILLSIYLIFECSKIILQKVRTNYLVNLMNPLEPDC